MGQDIIIVVTVYVDDIYWKYEEILPLKKYLSKFLDIKDLGTVFIGNCGGKIKQCHCDILTQICFGKDIGKLGSQPIDTPMEINHYHNFWRRFFATRCGYVPKTGW